MSRFLCAGFSELIWLSVLFSIATSTHAGSMADIVENKQITVAVQSEGPPFSFTNEQGNRTGLAVEIMRMLAKEIEVELVIKDYEWKGLSPALDKNEVDVVAADLSPTPKQFMQTLFTEPVFYNDTVAFTKKEKTYQHWRDLNQKYIRISVNKETTFADTVKSLLPNARLRKVEGGVSDIVPDVLEGRAIAGVSSLVSLAPFLGEASEIKILGEPLKREPLAFAVAPESMHLLLFMNYYIQTIKNDGRLQMLLDYWWNSMQWQEDN
ncbi:MAG: transporter substrate-binding domain-containing protein [Gammaproteobacteria bacterium]|nr:transporter substrate-binding domain-containing protein [Gammaproteobacteria bacterium]